MKQCWAPYHFGPSSSLRLSILDVWACKRLTLVYCSWDLATITCPRTIIENWNGVDGKSFLYENKLVVPPTCLELVLRFRGSEENNLWLYRDGVLHTKHRLHWIWTWRWMKWQLRVCLGIGCRTSSASLWNYRHKNLNQTVCILFLPYHTIVQDLAHSQYTVSI